MLALLMIGASLTAAPPRSADPDDDAETRAPLTEIVVTGQRLDAARARVEPALGASTYTLTNDTIENRPGGETRDLGSILVQVPGVGRDAQGSLIVRGAPGAVQYRLNNVILPQGVADFGDSLSARLADRTELITGALPAQYGLASGSVVNVTTKSGLSQGNGGQGELYGGSHRTIEPAFELSAARAGSSLFASGSLRRSDIGLPSPGPFDAAHDAAREVEGFAFIDHVIDGDSRVSLIAGTSQERKQVPALAVAGMAGSAARRGDSRSANHYLVASVQRSSGDFTLQASLSGLLSRASLAQDERLAVAIDGVAIARHERRAAMGTQVEAALTRGAHILRGGIVASADRDRLDQRIVTAGAVTPGRASEQRLTASLFVEDEWALSPRLTANLGVRGDRVSGQAPRLQLGPRASLTWAGAAGLTVHGGFARYAIAAPLGETITSFADRADGERDDYADLGAQRKLGDWTFGVDAYWRHAHHFLAERSLAIAPVAEAFNYRRATLRGVELLATYADGPMTAWGNLALAHATARGIATNAALFTPAERAFVDAHEVAIDLDQRVTASGGLSYRFGPLLLSGDLAYGSGARRTLAGGDPNGARLPGHATVDLAAVYHVKLIEDRPTDLRFDITNVADRRFALSDGSGLAGGAPQWTAGRGLFVGVEQSF